MLKSRVACSWYCDRILYGYRCPGVVSTLITPVEAPVEAAVGESSPSLPALSRFLSLPCLARFLPFLSFFRVSIPTSELASVSRGRSYFSCMSIGRPSARECLSEEDNENPADVTSFAAAMYLLVLYALPTGWMEALRWVGRMSLLQRGRDCYYNILACTYLEPTVQVPSFDPR